MQLLRQEGRDGKVLGGVPVPVMRGGKNNQVREVQEACEQVQMPEVRF